jgi:predicted CoA-binding protein
MFQTKAANGGLGFRFLECWIFETAPFLYLTDFDPMKPTLVLGASTNPARYANIAIRTLLQYEYTVYGLGLREGRVAGVQIQTDTESIHIPDLHTITLYIGPARQPQYYDWIISLNPKRVIFNPGTENPQFEALLKEHGIETIQACTLVMLSVGLY